MSRATFYFALALALLYPLATAVETTVYQLRLSNLEHQRGMESQLAVAQHTNSVAQQLVQRMSIDSMRDPALIDLLRKYGIQVKVTAPAAASGPPPLPSSVPPPASAAAAPASAPSTSNPPPPHP